MSTNHSKHPLSSSGPKPKQRGISRRDLLKVSARSLAGLLGVPLSYSLAGDSEDGSEAIKIMAAELLGDNSASSKLPTGLIFTNGSANGYICDPPLDGDVDGDCKVDLEDVKIMSSEWLNSDMSAESNLDWSCYIIDSASSQVCVDFEDFSLLAKDWLKQTSAISAISYIDLERPFGSKKRLA